MSLNPQRSDLQRPEVQQPDAQQPDVQQPDVPQPASRPIADAAPPTAWALPLDLSSATPVYVQLAQGVRSRIEAGELRGGAALPAERELAAALGVSRVTVRGALALLAEQGLLTRRHGSGTFVTPQSPQGPPRSLGLLSSFSQDVRSRGQVAGAAVLHFARTRPTAQEACSLNLPPSEAVYRIGRLRTADGEPLAVEESTLPAALVGTLGEADVRDASLYALLQSRGVPPHHAVRHLRAVNADLTLAGLLGVPVGAALLATERVSWTAGGQPIEFARAHYRGDRYDFVMELWGEGGPTADGPAAGGPPPGGPT